MKNFLTILLGIVCAAVLIFGHSYWSKQIQSASAKSENNVIEKQADSTQGVTDSAASNEQKQQLDLQTLTKNWPLAAYHQFNQDLAKHKAYKVLFVGSSAIGSETTGTYKLVKEQLLHTYGEENINVSLQTFDSSSYQLVRKDNEDKIIAAKADLLVLEPMLLLDNGVLTIDQSLNNVTQFISAVKASKPDTTFLIQPSYPLYNAKFYPRQVAELKYYAENNHIPYLDHWTAWPDTYSIAMKDDLLPNQSGPNDKGNQIWSNYLIHYFINK